MTIPLHQLVERLINEPLLRRIKAQLADQHPELTVEECQQLLPFAVTSITILTNNRLRRAAIRFIEGMVP